MKVPFVIPIRHPDGVADPCEAARGASADDRLRRGPDLAGLDRHDRRQPRTQVLPDLPEGVRVRHVDLPPNAALGTARDRPEIVAAIDLDKGQRVAAALTDVEPDDLIMVVDDDDLVHRDLVAFVAAEHPQCGWVIDNGFWWRSGSWVLHWTWRLNDRCGTSLLVPPHYYAHFTGDRADSDAIRELASHKWIFRRLPRSRRPGGTSHSRRRSTACKAVASRARSNWTAGPPARPRPRVRGFVAALPRSVACG